MKFTIKCSIVVMILMVKLNPLSAQQDLRKFNQKRIQIAKAGMYTLGGWAVVNIATGTAGSLTTDGEAGYLHQMNAYWNIVNAGIATIGILSLSGQRNENPTLSESLQQQSRLEKALLFNAGLDLGYIALGLFLKEKSKNETSTRLKGYGNSLLLQGGFLFIFDLTLYHFLHKNLRSSGIMERLSLQANYQFFRISYRI